MKKNFNSLLIVAIFIVVSFLSSCRPVARINKDFNYSKFISSYDYIVNFMNDNKLISVDFSGSDIKCRTIKGEEKLLIDFNQDDVIFKGNAQNLKGLGCDFILYDDFWKGYLMNYAKFEGKCPSEDVIYLIRTSRKINVGEVYKNVSIYDNRNSNIIEDKFNDVYLIRDTVH